MHETVVGMREQACLILLINRDRVMTSAGCGYNLRRVVKRRSALMMHDLGACAYAGQVSIQVGDPGDVRHRS